MSQEGMSQEGMSQEGMSQEDISQEGMSQEGDLEPEMTYRDNDVFLALRSRDRTTDCRFYVKEVSVTDGQDPNGKIKPNTWLWSEVKDGLGMLRCQCGRKASGKVADFWNQHIKASESTFNHGAGELNFAVYGDLIFDTKDWGYTSFSNVCLAQGSSGSTNNWWFGIKEATYIGDNKIRATSNNGKGTFDFLRGGTTNPVNVIAVTRG